MTTWQYLRTLLWAFSRRSIPRGGPKDLPYWRALELALLGVSRGYGVTFPAADGYTLLEFGVSTGDSFARLLHFRDVLCRRLRVHPTITALGFDTFTGLPAPGAADTAVPWGAGDFAAPMKDVEARLRGYDRYTLVPGLFSDTLPQWRDRLARQPPIFVSIDCDYYSSTMDVFTHLLPLLPTGALLYVDDAAAHYWSDRAGELQAIREVNAGCFGPQFSFSEYPLWIESRELRHYRQLYRFLNLGRSGFPSGAG